MSNNVGVIAKIIAADGQRDEVVEVLKQMFDQVKGEDGTLVYALHTVNDDPNAIIFYELYTDKAALDAHSGSDTMKAVNKALGGGKVVGLELTQLTPLDAKGIDL